MAARRALTLALAALAGLAALALVTSASAIACSKPLTLITEEWPPYAFNFGREVQTGLDIELARTILQEAGCSLVTLPAVPPARRMVLFERGEVDLLLAASDTPERRRFARFSIAYRNESVGLFVLAAHLERFHHIDSMDALVRAQAGLLAPTVGWYGKDYERVRATLKSRARLSSYSKLEQGMRMLAAGRAPLIMGDSAAIQYEARNQQLAVRQLPFTVLQAPVHLMLSRASTTAADLARIDAAIVRLERNGTLKNIRADYGLR